MKRFYYIITFALLFIVGCSQTTPSTITPITTIPDPVATSPNVNWNLFRIDNRTQENDEIYEYDATGKGVKVYIVDTGIWGNHEDFQGRVEEGHNFVFGEEVINTTDCHGHGTHVAGIIGSKTYGVAKEVNLIPIKVFPDCSGAGAEASDVIAAIDWIVDDYDSMRDATPIINIGLSFVGSSETLLETAIKEAVKKGIVFTITAGNRFGADTCQQSLTSLGEIEGVIVVGSTDDTDKVMAMSNQGKCVDIFAPGDDITSTWHGDITNDDDSNNNNNTSVETGGSMAVSHVAGVAALYLGQFPNATPAQVENAIISSATADILEGVDKSIETPNLFLYSRLNEKTSQP